MAKEYVVILAGGGGTRLWPKSRTKTPKQFLKLINNKTLFQETFDRARSLVPITNIYVVTGRNFVVEIKKETPEISDRNIIIEPSPKNTAPAIGLAATFIAKKDKDAIISTLAADHFIKEKSKFLETLSVAKEVANRGDFLVTVGIKPTHAHTGFGYIHAEEQADKVDKTLVFKVKNFKEKPDLKTAGNYLASNEYYWNANINTYRVTSLLGAINKFSPQLSDVLKMIGAGEDEQKIKKAWYKLLSEPIDTAILERAGNVLMVPSNFSWFDIGDWNTVYSILSKSSADDVVIGRGKSKYLGLNTQGNLVYTDNRLIATVGLKDLVVIDTADALLVCSKAHSQEVKRIVQKLIAGKKKNYL
jgi:mannose-1-phosphate guanylyltransferase